MMPKSHQPHDPVYIEYFLFVYKRGPTVEVYIGTSMLGPRLYRMLLICIAFLKTFLHFARPIA